LSVKNSASQLAFFLLEKPGIRKASNAKPAMKKTHQKLWAFAYTSCRFFEAKTLQTNADGVAKVIASLACSVAVNNANDRMCLESMS
jgi:hypothetical protein